MAGLLGGAPLYAISPELRKWWADRASALGDFGSAFLRSPGAATFDVAKGALGLLAQKADELHDASRTAMIPVTPGEGVVAPMARQKAQEKIMTGLLDMGALGGIVSPKVAATLKTIPALPANPEFRAAVANTPGASLADNGLLMRVTRSQQPEQALEHSVRGGVFYLPEGSPQMRYYGTGASGYGGAEKISGETLISRPLLAKGGTGGSVPKNAFDTLFGKGAYEQMRGDALSAIHYGQSSADKAQKVQSFLEKYAPEMADQADNIIANSGKSNQLPYALQEAAVASGVRRAGHDAVIGYSRQRTGNPFLSEVFDVRERTYPDKFGTPTKLWEQFTK